MTDRLATPEYRKQLRHRLNVYEAEYAAYFDRFPGGIHVNAHARALVAAQLTEEGLQLARIYREQHA